MKALSAWIKAYIHHPDPLTNGVNLVAAIIVSNQPFYPLYVLWAAGWEGWPAFAAYGVMPLFAITPMISRASPLMGRMWFCMIGTGNTVLTTKLLGQESGVELFHYACIAVAALFFRASERAIMIVMAAIPILLAWSLDGNYGRPVAQITPEQYESLFRLHAMSVAALIIFLGIVISNITSPAGGREERS